MAKLSSGINTIINQLNGDMSLYKRIKRADQVKEMWAGCVDPIFLEHTNSIFIFTEENEKILVVYVDESIFAAELNAQRELIKLKLLQKYNEDVNSFKIYISRGQYKKNYPFKDSQYLPQYNSSIPIPLNSEEKEKVEEIISCIEDKNLKEKVRKAIVLDLEWKKSKNKEEKTQ